MKLGRVNAAEQIEKLKGYVLLFSENLRSLIQTFEMLRLVVENKALLQQYSGTKRARGLLVLRWSMIQECLIGITKLALDQQPNNPSARNLINELLSPAAQPMRDKLKADFAVPIKPAPPPGTQTPERLKESFGQFRGLPIATQGITPIRAASSRLLPS